MSPDYTSLRATCSSRWTMVGSAAAESARSTGRRIDGLATGAVSAYG